MDALACRVGHRGQAVVIVRIGSGGGQLFSAVYSPEDGAGDVAAAVMGQGLFHHAVGDFRQTVGVGVIIGICAVAAGDGPDQVAVFIGAALFL